MYPGTVCAAVHATRIAASAFCQRTSHFRASARPARVRLAIGGDGGEGGGEGGDGFSGGA